MKTDYQFSSTQDFESIVFENRNQQYGAYQLRKSYPKNMNRALWIGVFCISLALIVPVVYGELQPKDLLPTFETEHSLANIPPPPPTNPKMPNPPLPKLELPKIKTIAFPPPLPTPDAELPPETSEIPTVAEVSKAVIGTKNSEGEAADPDLVIDHSANTENQNIVAIEQPEENTVFLYAEQNPQFQGGTQELMKYLMHNLRYPRAAQNQGIEGKVYVSFVVGKDGKIYDVKIAKGLGYGCDDEAMRVVAAMPTWVAGKQNGKAVAVRYHLPIVFKLNNN